MLDNPAIAGFVRAPDLTTWWPLGVGLAIAVAAEIFRQGTRLRTEVEGLV